MNIVGPLAEVVEPYAEDSLFDCFAEQCVPEWLEVLGEDADDINAHGVQHSAMPTGLGLVGMCLGEFQ